MSPNTQRGKWDIDLMGKGALELLPSIRNLLDDQNHSNEATLQSVWPSVKFGCPLPVRYLLGWETSGMATIHCCTSPVTDSVFGPKDAADAQEGLGDHRLLWSGPKEQ